MQHAIVYFFLTLSQNHAYDRCAYFTVNVNKIFLLYFAGILFLQK